jgi:hypothetical protein
MDVRWKFRRLGQDELERVAVGDPDPRPRTPVRPTCRFEWLTRSREPDSALVLHSGAGTPGPAHAGTGECVAAVRDS